MVSWNTGQYRKRSNIEKMNIFQGIPYLTVCWLMIAVSNVGHIISDNQTAL